MYLSQELICDILVKYYFLSLRPSNWIKNAFVAFPIVFSLNLFDIEKLTLIFITIIAFSLLCSSIYVINDLIDIDIDKCHPKKSKRPIAAGKVSVIQAITILILALIGSFVISSIFLKVEVLYLFIIYFILNLLYCIILKHINLIEAFVIPLNFLIRIVIGCVVISVYPSFWIIAVTFFIALLLTFIKRKSEIQLLEINDSIKARKVLSNYNLELMNVYIFVCATITVMTYMLYTLDKTTETNFNTQNLFYTTPLVLIGIFRFIQLSFLDSFKGIGDPTSLLLKDRFLQFSVLIWISAVIFLIYF